VLQAMAARTQPVARLERVPVAFGGQGIEVEVMPLNGLIDLNRAPTSLLAVLFEVAGQLEPQRASGLARAVATARIPVPGTAAGPRFEAVEDLLQLPGVDYDLYARLTRLVTTDSAGSGRVNAMAAPAEVLRVLSQGDAGLAERIAASRDAGNAGVDTTALPAAFLDNAAATRFRLVARVALGDGRRLASMRLVDMGRVGRDGVPWRVFHAEEQFEPMPATMN
jgi:general secretion pathway protein K